MPAAYLAGPRVVWCGRGFRVRPLDRNLIQRDERRRALRFKEAPNGPLLANGDNANVPPLIRLGELFNAAMRVAAENNDDADQPAACPL